MSAKLPDSGNFPPGHSRDQDSSESAKNTRAGTYPFQPPTRPWGRPAPPFTSLPVPVGFLRLADPSAAIGWKWRVSPEVSPHPRSEPSTKTNPATARPCKNRQPDSDRIVTKHLSCTHNPLVGGSSPSGPISYNGMRSSRRCALRGQPLRTTPLRTRLFARRQPSGSDQWICGASLSLCYPPETLLKSPRQATALAADVRHYGKTCLHFQ